MSPSATALAYQLIEETQTESRSVPRRPLRRPKISPLAKLRTARPQLSLCKVPAPVQAAEEPVNVQQLIIMHQENAIRLAVSLLKRWGSTICREELQSITNVALCQAANAFDPTRGTKFQSFFYYYIKGQLIRHIIGRVEDSEMLTSIEPFVQPDGNISARTTENHPAFVAKGMLADEALGRSAILRFCEEHCRTLDELDREVLTRRYFRDQDLKTIARELGYSRGHLSRIHSRAIANLRAKLVAQGAIDAGN